MPLARLKILEFFMSLKLIETSMMPKTINKIEPDWTAFNDSLKNRIENRTVNIIEEFAIGDIIPNFPRLNAFKNVDKGMKARTDMANAIRIYFDENVVPDRKKGSNRINIRHMKMPLKKTAFLTPSLFAGIGDRELLNPKPIIEIRPKMMPEEMSISISYGDNLYILA